MFIRIRNKKNGLELGKKWVFSEGLEAKNKKWVVESPVFLMVKRKPRALCSKEFLSFAVLCWLAKGYSKPLVVYKRKPSKPKGPSGSKSTAKVS